MNLSAALCLILSLLLGATLSLAQKHPAPQSAAILGDSSSVGILAKFERAKAHNILYQFKLIGGFLPLLVTLNKKSIASPNLSWAEGTNEKVQGQIWRLKQLNPQMDYKNFSVAGVYSSHVATEQLEAARSWSRQNNRHEFPDFVSLFVGANDLCQTAPEKIPSVASYQKNISHILWQVLSSPNAHLLVLPLPHFENLKRNVEAAKVLGAKGMGIVNTCDHIWKLAPLCPTLTHELSPSDREKVVGRIQGYNKALFAEVAKHRRLFGDRVRIATAIKNFELMPDDVSIDCFHPNWKLHKRVAETVWPYTWWASR